MTIRKTLLTIAALSLMAPAVSASATDASTANVFTVKTTTDYRVKKAAKAFRKGEFERSIAYSNKALNAGLSSKRKAIAYTNICAAEASLGNMEAAAEACDSALNLRPDYAPAVSNKAALRVMLAQK